MENDRSLKVDVAVNGYRDEDGKYNILSYDVDTPSEQGFKEEFDSSVAIVAGVNQDGKRVLISEAALEKNQLSGDVLELTDIENDKSKPIEVKDISEFEDNPAVDELRKEGITENHLIVTTNKLLRDHEPITPYTLDEVAKQITKTSLKLLKDSYD